MGNVDILFENPYSQRGMNERQKIADEISYPIIDELKRYREGIISGYTLITRLERELAKTKRRLGYDESLKLDGVTLDEVKCSTRLYNIIQRVYRERYGCDVEKIYLEGIARIGREEMLKTRNLGAKTYAELENLLKTYAIKWEENNGSKTNTN